MGNHKLEVVSSSKAKKMKSKTKDTNVEIELAMLGQIHFLTCMYIAMWAIKKEEHAQMIKEKLDDFYQLDQNTIDLHAVKQIICDFQVQNVACILQVRKFLQILLTSVEFSS